MRITVARAKKAAIRRPALCAGLILVALFYGLSVGRRRLQSSRAALADATKAAQYSKTGFPRIPDLRITDVVQHGRILEIKGFTEPGAIVMINGQPPATIFDHNSFRQFVGPFPAGITIIAITAQNDDGGVNTQQLAFTVD